MREQSVNFKKEKRKREMKLHTLIPYVGMLCICLIANGCKKDEIDFDRISKLRPSPTVILPVVNFTMQVGDLLKLHWICDADTAG